MELIDRVSKCFIKFKIDQLRLKDDLLGFEGNYFQALSNDVNAEQFVDFTEALA